MQPLPWTLSQLLLSLRYPACLVQAASVLRGLTGLPPSSSMCSSGVLALHSGGTVLRFCSESLEWWWGPGRVLAHVFSVGIPWQCEENGVLRLALRQESVETKNWTLPKPLLLLPSGAMLCLTFFLLSHFLSSLSSFCPQGTWARCANLLVNSQPQRKDIQREKSLLIPCSFQGHSNLTSSVMDRDARKAGWRSGIFFLPIPPCTGVLLMLIF
jgi:hypothetical protein